MLFNNKRSLIIISIVRTSTCLNVGVFTILEAIVEEINVCNKSAASFRLSLLPVHLIALWLELVTFV